MKQTAAQLAVYALEQLGITHTFGIPGVHNTELYDALQHSKTITPMLVTNEQAGAFIAEGMSRVSTLNPTFINNRAGNIGTLVLVPAAGLTHAASGIGEAYLDGVPMLVITGGIRQDTQKRYQLHEVDQLTLAQGFTKAAFRPSHNREVVETFYQAYDIATSGVPGPVLIELPVNLQLFADEVPTPISWKAWRKAQAQEHAIDEVAIETAANLLVNAKQVGLFVGYGARTVTHDLVTLAELLNAPVTTTLQGLSVFPHTHPLHAGFGFSPSAVPAARRAIAQCDTLLTIGARFAEIPTGSFGISVPPTHIHLDIDPGVIGANYPTSLGIVGDASVTVPALVAAIKRKHMPAPKTVVPPRALSATPLSKQPTQDMAKDIAKHKAAYRKTWYQHHSGKRVNPIQFFDVLRQLMPDDSITVLDDGNHTFLAAELYPIHPGGTLLTPTDFNAMGYAVPAAIGAKLASPQRDVVAIVGDGCFTMTCMEILTAKANRLGILYCVFHDGELSQIAQAQALPYQQKACTILPTIDIKGVAQATGASYFNVTRAKQLKKTLAKAYALTQQGQPVIVDIAIDYSKATAFTLGTTKTNFASFKPQDKLRFIKRIIRRKLPF